MRLLFLLLVVWHSPLVSADVISDMCAAYQDELKRSSCEDEMQALSEKNKPASTREAVKPKPQKPEKTILGSRWTFSGEKLNHVVGEKEVSVWVPANEQIYTGYSDYFTPRFVLMCRSGELDVFVDWKFPVTRATVPVVIYGKGLQRHDANWVGSFTGTQLFYPHKRAGRLMEVLYRLNDLTVSTTTDSGKQITSTFELTGITDVTKYLRGHCRFQGERPITDYLKFE